MENFRNPDEQLKKKEADLAKLEAELKQKGNELDQRGEALSQRDAELAKLSAEIARKAEALAVRENAIRSAEADRDSGWAVERLEFDDRLAELRKAFDRDINAKRETADKEFAARLAEIEAREAAVREQVRGVAADRAAIAAREAEIRKAEAARDTGWAEERDLFEKELAEHRSRVIATVETDAAKIRNERAAELDAKLAEIMKQRTAEMEAAEAASRSERETERKALAEERAELARIKTEVEGARDDVEFDKRAVASRRAALDEREEDLNAEIDRRVETYRKDLEAKAAVYEADINALRSELAAGLERDAAFEAFKRRLGDEPETVMQRFTENEAIIKQLRSDLASRPSDEVREEISRVAAERDNLMNRNRALEEAARRMDGDLLKLREKEAEAEELRATNRSLSSQKSMLEAEAIRLGEELRRLTASYEREQDRDARIRDIKAPLIETAPPRLNVDTANPESMPNEIAWLDGILNHCENYGVKFERRILHAFHTALKTAEWSPITVLAGVSGTGKSELPRLYSHFGGLNFLPLSVQPNWDSQESMLGFFNSIDNKFDAQPVLRLLAQSQQQPTQEEPWGLGDTMSLILLDEMNLAYVELYFAEFLSKFELRRGRKVRDEPSLNVKLGAGLAPYLLRLGRNVLWTGTMNQDETTKSLSDKVLDRGIVINFPRPKKLVSRRALNPLTDPAPLIPSKLWGVWRKMKSMFADEGHKEELIKKYKQFIESVNDALSFAGRALGHRVWQSIEYYMSNYPEVIAADAEGNEDALRRAMRVSFEDALVQKVMPKLRGIETSGTHRERCLDEIKRLLEEGVDGKSFSIIEDYNRAIDFGYGQFMWNSAEYLREDTDVDAPAESDHTEPAPTDTNDPAPTAANEG